MATEQEQPPKKEKKSVKKLWKKVKDFFKDKPATPTAAAASTSIAAPAASSPSAPAPVTSKPESASATKPDESPVRSPRIEVDDNVEDIPAATTQGTVQLRPIKPSSETGQLTEPEMRFNKAQAIFAKYNLELSEADWDMRPKVPYERVAKNIRMRVRYTCHNCSTTFGHERVCVGCQHRRCTKCSRYPPKKDKAKTTKTDVAAPSAAPLDPSENNNDAACHECQTGFNIGTEECPNCHHKICERCLQEATITVEHLPGAAGAGQKTSTEGVGTAS
ncbi:uncharacterized protein A1O9_11056 [Exophiala aquamarina CBS 119918]|uniref:Uncharacterized protein n=1 Tax=Exophiala aquamarina CBS 119918 TaxID=1182545 RepID=A0A072P0D4_9EURO|nr:uncharacterized protein A1O9_11056 [Exophiala aquamarina CBS 119918]KEF53147.1 hypothetical protein A1O9_11056 [Exophiala aquamarina CBS 119918]